MPNMSLDTFLSLKQTSTLSIAKRFWDLPQVKKRLLTFLKDSVKMKPIEIRQSGMELIEELLTAWNTYDLPINLKRYLLYAIKEVGQKIFDWVEWIQSETKYRIPKKNTAENAAIIISSIRWTPCGIVDEFKTYQMMSEMDSNFDISILYRVACSHTMEDQIISLWKRMSESERKSLEYSVILDEDYMVAYWQYRRDNNLDALKVSFRLLTLLQPIVFCAKYSMRPFFAQSYDENLSVHENMMLASMYDGLINSVKYFWARLPEDYKIDKLFDYLHLTLMLYADKRLCYEDLVDYRRGRLARVCVFFITQMNDDHREIFQRTTTATAIFEETHKINVSRMDCLLRPAWPWHNFVSLGLKDLIYRRKFPTKLAHCLLCELTRIEAEQFRRGLIVNGNELRSLIQDIWKSVPRKQKKFMISSFSTDYMSKRFISNLINARDFETLRVIVNESEIGSVRDRLVGDVLKMGGSLIETDDYELLEELINHLATSSEERLTFRSHVDCLEYFVRREEYDLADKFLDWRCWEPQMNEDVKKRRVMELKRRLKYQLSRDDWVVNLWIKFSTNVDEAMKRCSKLINWVFMTKKERDQFIGDKLVDAEYFSIHRRLSTEVIWKFCSWCRLAQKEPFYDRYEID